MHINKYFIATLLSVGILKGTSNAQDLSREMDGNKDMEMKVKVEKEDGSESKEKVEIEGNEKTYKFENEQYELKVKKEKDEVKLKYEGDPNQFEQNVSKHLKGSSQGNQTNMDLDGNNNYFPHDPSVNIINGSPNLGDTTNACLDVQDETSANARQRWQNESLGNNQGNTPGRNNNSDVNVNPDNRAQEATADEDAEAVIIEKEPEGVIIEEDPEALRKEEEDAEALIKEEEEAEALTNEEEDNSFDMGQQSNASKDSKSLRSKYENDPDFKSESE